METCVSNHSEVAETIQERIIRLRGAKRWSQEEFGRVAGISKATIQEIEGGKSRKLRGSTVRAIATALGVTPDFLEHGIDGPDFSKLAERAGVTIDELYKAVQIAVDSGKWEGFKVARGNAAREQIERAARSASGLVREIGKRP